MRQAVQVAIVRLDHALDLPLPDYATGGSAGVDLTAAVADPVTLGPGERLLVPTGIAIALPDGFEAQVRSRSGLAWKHGVTVLNSPGTIDADYRGEVKVIMFNASSDPFVVSRGMRIAQMVVAPVSRLQWGPVDRLPASGREAGGFGSTGLR
ncbi:MAG: dUTP diphosphatase [Alphaproteobacteria bacterium]